LKGANPIMSKPLTKTCGGKFAFVPADVLESRHLSRGEFWLFTVLCRHADKDGKCWRSNETLAAQARTTPRTIQRWRRTLEEAGLVKVEGRHRNANLYKVIRDPKDRLTARTEYTAKVFRNRQRFAEYGRKGAARRAEVRAQKVAGEKELQPVGGDTGDTPEVTGMTPPGVTLVTPKDDPVKDDQLKDDLNNEGKTDMENGTAAAAALASPLDSGSRSGRSSPNRQQPELMMGIAGGKAIEDPAREADPAEPVAPRNQFEEDSGSELPCPQPDQAEPKAPPARQRVSGGNRTAEAKERQRLGDAMNRWQRALLEQDGGFHIWSEVSSDEETMNKATEAELKTNGAGLPIILAWHRDQASDQTAAA